MNRVLVLLLLCVPVTAKAYVRTRTSTGTPIAWRQQCPQIALDATENPTLPLDRLRAALERSAAAWNTPTDACTAPQLVILPGTVHGKDVAYDDTNVLLWRMPGFCDDAAHAHDDVCVSPNAAAVTTVFYYDKPGDDKDGTLVGIDIEINATHFTFSDDGSIDKIDIENTMTHEFGHVLGLDHTCYTIGGTAPPVDAEGKPVPSCFPIVGLPPEVTQATMFNYEAPGETSKRVPQPDETRGVCEIYTGHTRDCEPPDMGCEFIPRSRALPLGIALLVALAIVCLSRRRR